MSHLDDYEPGVRCEACSAHFPVSVFHPVDRPCDRVDLRAAAIADARSSGHWDADRWSRIRSGVQCICRPEGLPYAGCPFHGEYPG